MISTMRVCVCVSDGNVFVLTNLLIERNLCVWCFGELEKNDGELKKSETGRKKHGSPMANSVRAGSNTCCFEQ